MRLRLQTTKGMLVITVCVITLFFMIKFAVQVFSFISYSDLKKGGILVMFSRKPSQIHYVLREEMYDRTRLTDTKSASTHLAFTSNSLQKSYLVGDIITVNFQVLNGYKKAKIQGGDMIVAKLTGKEHQSSVAGHVVDKGNGLYMAVIKACSVGVHNLTITLLQAREFVGMVFQAKQFLPALLTISSQFRNEKSKISEETLCHMSPEKVEGSSEVCNLTAENYNLPWYCGKPKNKKLLCLDWMAVRCVTFPDLHLNKEESHILTRITKHNFPLLHQKINVKKDKNERLPPANIPCHKRPRAETWAEKVPVGYIHKKRWFLTGCVNGAFTAEKVAQCLTNRTLFLFGDSTLRQWFFYLKNFLKCQMLTENWEHTAVWHKPAIAIKREINFTLHWKPHAMPLYIGDVFGPRAFQKAIHAYLDMIDQPDDAIVVIHIYSHFLTFHDTYFRKRIRKIRESVEKILQRSPKITVAIKGPHIYFHTLPEGVIRFSPAFGPLYDEIIKAEFTGLANRVIYLDFWDMTIASNSYDIHPNRYVVKNMVEQFLSYTC